MKTMSKSLKTSMDRFTSLPEDVAHQIITFLSMEDMSRLSVVSRRCRQLCISIPFLNVDVEPYQRNATKRTRLMNYVDRLLLLRGGMSTHLFRIHWNLDQRNPNYGGEEEEEYRVLSWLHNAVKCKVKVLRLILRLKSGSEFALPPSLLCSTSLESLLVDIDINGILKFPSYSSMGIFSSLKSLTLSCVRIDESFCNWVSTSCNFLEILHLLWVKMAKSIVINSSSLIILYIDSIDDELCHLQVSAERLLGMILSWKFDSSNNMTLKLSVPKIRNFAWRGILSVYLSQKTWLV